jgi:hypothetical protein
MDAKRRAILASAGLAFGNFNMSDDTAIVQVPDAKTMPELFADGSQIFNGKCCSRCAHRFGGSNHKFCVTHCEDEKCVRFKLDK